MSEDGHIVAELPGAHVLFTSRHGGVSPAPYDSLNLGWLTSDEPVNVARNRELVERRCGVRLAYGLQVHSGRVRTVQHANGDGEAPQEGDGLATASHGIGVMVLAADCLPIAIAGGGAVAIVHAGWQGLAGDVIAAGVQALRALTGAGAPLAAVIGPGAGPCCYEVGEDLHARFAARGQDFHRDRCLDLAAIARAQLEAAGVDEIEDVERCTICTGGDSGFFSHRRDGGVTGRQAGIAWLS